MKNIRSRNVHCINDMKIIVIQTTCIVAMIIWIVNADYFYQTEDSNWKKFENVNSWSFSMQK